MKRAPRIKVYQSTDGSWHVTILAANNRKLYHAGGYNTARNAERSLTALHSALWHGESLRIPSSKRK